jgi:hypothetical protein
MDTMAKFDRLTNSTSCGPFRVAPERSGSALVTVMIGMFTVTMLGMAVMQVTLSADRKEQAAIEDAQALYLAESALEDAAASLIMNSSGAIGSSTAPVRFGAGLYWVESQQVDDEEYLLRATAMIGAGRAALESRVVRSTSGSITRALLSNRKMDIKKGFFADSYDSALGSYASQAVNDHGKYDYADDGAIVISNDKLRIEKDAFVGGDIFAGPTATVQLKDKKGDLSITGQMGSLSAPVSMPPLSMPSCGPSAGKLHLHGNNSLPGFDLLLSPGTYHWDEFKIHKDTEAKIVGPATIVVGTKLEIDAGLQIDDTNGPVVFYVGKEAKIKKDADIAVASNSAAGLWIGLAHPPEYDANGKKKKVKHKVKVEGTFTGVIYAPDAKVEFKKEAVVYGSVMANEVKFKAGGTFHYDEALSRIGAPFGGDKISVSTLNWRVTNMANPEWTATRTDPFALLGVKKEDLLLPSQAWAPQPASQTSSYGAWGPDLFGWDEKSEDTYDDPEDNQQDSDTGYQ